MTAPRAAMLSVHTSPVDQPGTGDSGGMNVYMRSVATRLQDRGIDVDLFTRCRGGVDHETKHLTAHAHVVSIKAGPCAPIPSNTFQQSWPHCGSRDFIAVCGFSTTSSARTPLSITARSLIFRRTTISG